MADDLNRAGQAGASAINTGFARPGSGSQLGTMGEAKAKPGTGATAAKEKPVAPVQRPGKMDSEAKILGMKKNVFVAVSIGAGVLLLVAVVFSIMKLKNG